MADINGNNKDNILDGTSDPDNIFGFGGNDIVEGFGGADEMHGGNGLDTLSYTNSSVAVNVQISMMDHLARAAVTPRVTLATVSRTCSARFSTTL